MRSVAEEMVVKWEEGREIEYVFACRTPCTRLRVALSFMRRLGWKVERFDCVSSEWKLSFDDATRCISSN